ncbi:hypothetical protein T01_13677 [Trichinella spiralis]|uniref:Uncharacterized protein n=1 Tax=Trichinella spiralis TaxID=6334 RepID=A0A0V1AKW7_TRISP|nr:hypothetical protein T01_13677 [Trichinella spiralis]
MLDQLSSHGNSTPFASSTIKNLHKNSGKEVDVRLHCSYSSPQA